MMFKAFFRMKKYITNFLLIGALQGFHNSCKLLRCLSVDVSLVFSGHIEYQRSITQYNTATSEQKDTNY